MKQLLTRGIFFSCPLDLSPIELLFFLPYKFLLNIGFIETSVHFLLMLIYKISLVLGDLSGFLLLQFHFIYFVLKGLEFLFLHFLVVDIVNLVLVFVLLEQAVLVSYDSVEVPIRFLLNVLHHLV
jgi:hypothetical protein